MGGVFFCLLVLQNQASVFVAAKLYLEYYNGENKIEDAILWSVLLSLLGMFVISTTAFFSLIDKSYLHTFTSALTARQSCAKIFRDSLTDLEKLQNFALHPSYYAAFDDELKAFVRSNWATWQAEKPDWFTENIIATIPIRFISEIEVERMSEGQVSSGNGGGGARVIPITD